MSKKIEDLTCTKRKRYTTYFILASFICGWCLGYSYFYQSAQVNGDYAIEKVEGYLNYEGLPEVIKVRMKGNLTLNDMKGLYYQYKPYIDTIILHELKLICTNTDK